MPGVSPAISRSGAICSIAFGTRRALRASLLGHIGGGFSLAAPTPKGSRNRPSLICTASFPAILLEIRRLSRKARAGSKPSCAIAAARSAHRSRDIASGSMMRSSTIATFTSVLNAAGRSRRRASKPTIDWALGDQLRLSANYAYLKATQPDAADRRAGRRSAPAQAQRIDCIGRAVGPIHLRRRARLCRRHFDNRDTFPFDRVGLGSYWLADARVAYAIRPGIELFARGSNPLDQHYQDAFNYRTEDAPSMRGSRSRRGEGQARRIGDHRGELASVAISRREAPCPRTCRRVERFWTNSTSSRRRTPGSTGFLNFTPSIDMK